MNEEFALISVSTAERLILKDLLEDDSSRIDVIVPAVMDPEQLWSTLDACCRVAGSLNKASAKVKPILGRLLAVLRGQKEILESKGYQSYEDFIQRCVVEKYGISRPEAYACRLAAEKLPTLATEDFEAIGVAKVYTLSRVTGAGEANYKELVEYAKDPSVTKSDLISRAATLNGDATMMDAHKLSHLTILVPKDIVDRWREFVKSPEIQAACSTGGGTPANEAMIFSTLMDVAEAELVARGNQLVGASRHGVISGEEDIAKVIESWT